MASSKSSRPRHRGSIGWLPSGSARVKVYAGVDQLTGTKMWLGETVPAREDRKETEREAARAGFFTDRPGRSEPVLPARRFSLREAGG
jgi:hypothetical protein